MIATQVALLVVVAEKEYLLIWEKHFQKRVTAMAKAINPQIIGKSDQIVLSTAKKTATITVTPETGFLQVAFADRS